MGLKGSGSQPTSTATPTTPRSTPEIFLAVSGSPSQKAATSAVNITVVEFRMAASDAVKCTSAAEISENGTAVLKNPTNNSGNHRPRTFNTRLPAPAQSASATAARPPAPATS